MLPRACLPRLAVYTLGLQGVDLCSGWHTLRETSRQIGECMARRLPVAHTVSLWMGYNLTADAEALFSAPWPSLRTLKLDLRGCRAPSDHTAGVVLRCVGAHWRWPPGVGWSGSGWNDCNCICPAVSVRPEGLTSVRWRHRALWTSMYDGASFGGG